MIYPVKTYVEVNGVDVSIYCAKWEYEREFDDDISTIKIYLNRNVSSVITLTKDNIGDDVVVKRGASTGSETIIFKGQVREVNPGGTIILLKCNDRLFEARLATVTKSFDKNIDTEAGKFSEIFKTLINDYTGLTADATSVQDSGTTNTLMKFICNNADVFERISKLAETLNWQFYYDSQTDLVYFEPKGFVNNSVSFTVGSEIVDIPAWTFDSSQLVNHLKIVGAEQEVETTELFNGTGTQDTFTLTYTPASVKVYVDGVLKKGGKEGSTSGSYQYEVDTENKQIVFTTGNEPASGSENVKVDYSYMLPSPVVGKRQTSIDAYGDHQKTIFKEELRTMDDAKTFMNKYLDKYAEPFINSKLKVVSATEVDPGEVVEIIDDVNNIDKSLIVNKVTMVYPYKNDVIEVGDKLLKTSDWMAGINDRVRRLEEQAGKSTDLLLHVIDSFHESVTFERRYTKLIKNDVAGSVMIWDNTTYGIWGDQDWGASALVSSAVIRLIPGNKDFKEYFYDEEFVDTSVSTATVDTVNNTVS